VLERVARWCHRERWIVVVGWLTVLVFVAGTAKAFGGELSNQFKVPGAESQRAFDILIEKVPEQAGAGAQIVFHAKTTVDDPAVKQHMTELFTKLESVPKVASVSSPYGPLGAFQVSKDRRIAFATIQFNVTTLDVPTATVKDVLRVAERSSTPAVQVEVGGEAVQFAAQTDVGSSERIGLLAAMFVLLLTFGSVVAMGLPLGTALFGLGVGLASVPIAGRFIDIPIFGPSLAAMIGLGVGIDYALFIVTRFRTSLHDGAESEDACATALTTSGRAVIFAGITVCISMLGLFVMGIPLVRGMAVSAMVAVILTMIASITLLPALLGFAGPSIDRFSIPGRSTREASSRTSRWFRWSRFIQRHPWPAAFGALLVLLLLASPVLSMRLGSTDAGSNPKSSTTRRAYDLITDGFGPGYNGPLLVAAEVGGMRDFAALQKLSDAIRATPDVALVAPPILGKSGDAAIILVVPKSAPQDQATEHLIDVLRNDVIPQTLAGTNVVVHVGGVTAIFNDLSHALSKRLPLFMATVIGLSFLLLLVVFRSVLVPLKAAVMNLLSIGASYGVIVAVFQWGWLGSIVGVDRTGPIQAFVPMMLFAILFGLSMDYEVFLISRMREEYLRTGNNAEAVADGLAVTARVITAAAAIMITVFGSFIFQDNTILKLFGLGLSTAILMDATIVRTVLVPATMELLGDRNWWFPAWLDRLVPNIAIEGEHHDDVIDLTDDALAAEIDGFGSEIVDLADAPEPAVVAGR
jgi:RND superfamily putative drug exporter